MDIACPQCSTTYVLDERLIPPSGAPVQCTRCNHAFTAHPPGSAAPTTPVRSTSQYGAIRAGDLGAPHASGAAPRSTQMMGTVGPPSGETPRVSTQMMGAVGAPSGEKPRVSTQMMGAVRAPSGETPRVATQMMGAVRVPSGETPRVATQMMGAVAAPSGETPRVATQVMGAVGAPSGETPRMSTQVMGAVAAPSGGTPRVSTQVMGAVGTPSGDTPRMSTQVMGAVDVSSVRQPERASTQMMGAVGRSAGAPGDLPGRASTQVMGVAAPAGPPTARVPFDAPLPADGLRAAEVIATPAMGVPIVEAGVATSAAPGVQGLERSATPLMGAVTTAPRSGTAEMGTISTTPRAATLAFGAPEADASLRSATSQMGLVLPTNDELEAGLGTALSEAPLDAGAQGPSPEPVAAPRPRVSLPDDPMPLPLGRSTLEEMEALRGSRASVPVWAVLGVAVLLLGGGLVWKLAGGSGDAIAEVARSKHDDAVRLLRRDDQASRSQAQRQFEALVRQYPSFVEARADLALVFALELDDLKATADGLHAAQARLRMQVEALQRAKTPGDWQNRVNALEDELGGHERELAKITGEETKLREQLSQTLQSLPELEERTTAPVRLAVTRAGLMAAAVEGSPEALALGDRYLRLGVADGWNALAYATYVLHSRGSLSAGAAEARAGLSALKDQDASSLRAYVLDARLAHATGDLPASRSNLDSVLTLNPEHALAARLREFMIEAQSRMAQDGLGAPE